MITLTLLLLLYLIFSKNFSFIYLLTFKWLGNG